MARDEVGALRAIIDKVGDQVADTFSVSSLEATAEGFIVTILGPVLDIQKLVEPILQ